MKAILVLAVFLLGCGPVPWAPCPSEVKGTKRCSPSGEVVERCDGRWWHPDMNCENDLTGPDGNPVVEKCVEEGGGVSCQSK